MNEPTSITEAQVRQLLDVLEQHRAKNCAKIRAEAEKRGHEVIAKAHKEARQRTQDDFSRMRAQSQRQLISAQARIKTKKRLARQQADEAVLQAGWTLLHAALQQRWKQAESRRQWVDTLVNEALQTLLAKHWQIDHPADWPDVEGKALQQRLNESLGNKPDLRADADIQAGLRLCSEGTCVDGTSTGLLHDRARIEAMLLASIHRHDEIEHG